MKPKIKVSLFILSIFTFLPVQMMAHGTEEEHQREVAISPYFFAGSLILLIVFLSLFFITRNKVKQLENVKKQEDRIKRQQLSQSMSGLKWVSIAAVLATLISGGAALSANQQDAGLKNADHAEGVSSDSDNAKAVTLTHIHGLGYSPDGTTIMIPAHDGLKVYSNGTWSNGPGELHDYMGFSAVSDGFYSSGHPALGSSKLNPFGIVKSTDGGISFDTLTLYGKVDFHLMNVSYNKHTIYVVNPESNSEMKETGLYYSKDQAKTWIKSQMEGFDGEPVALAVHPNQDNIVALGSKQGLYVSRDYGDTFEKLSGNQVTSLYFNPQGDLFVGEYNQVAKLLKISVESGEQEEISIPSLTANAVMYIAQHPLNEKEWLFASFNKDVYLTKDQGEEWIQIADQGNGISQ